MFLFLVLAALMVIAGMVMFSAYTVVTPNQAHIVTRMSGGRTVFSPKIGDNGRPLYKTAYFYFPMVMKRQVLDLTNVKMEINNIELHDKEVAPFMCDVVCWFHVINPDLAAERLDLRHPEGNFGSVLESLRNLIPAVAREVAMKQEVLDIMRDRKTFGDSLSQSVEIQIEKWGVTMVDLEINDIRDAANSAIIGNYESMRQNVISSTARKQNAQMVQEAIVAEQGNKQLAEMKTAEVEETFRKRQIAKDKEIGIAEADRDLEIAKSTELANKQKVSAQQTLEVGQAEIKAQAVVKVATGEADAIKVKGEKQAEVIKLTGTAEASVVEAKGLAEAKAKDAMAEALKKFTEAGITLEQIKAFVEVQKSKYGSIAAAFQAANINLTSSDPQKIFGFGLDAEGGASLSQFIKTLEASTGKKLPEIVDAVKKTVSGKE